MPPLRSPAVQFMYTSRLTMKKQHRRRLLAIALLASLLPSVVKADVCRLYSATTWMVRTDQGIESYNHHTDLECAFMDPYGDESDDFALVTLPPGTVLDNNDDDEEQRRYLEYDATWLTPGLPPHIKVPSSSKTLSLLTHKEVYPKAHKHHHQHHPNHHLRRQLQNKSNNSTAVDPTRGVVLAARVTLRDAAPRASKLAIERALFGRRNSFQSQTEACSFGKETIVPYNASERVYQVYIDANVANMTYNGLFLEANQVLKQYLKVSNTRSIAQFAMFFAPVGLSLPSGAEGSNPVAYAATNHYKSVYSDFLINTTQAFLHMTG
jgi:hypothetical protein